MNIELLINSHIKNLKPYQCARDEYKGKNAIFLDANENPYGEWNRYPDPYQQKLKEKIATIKNVSPEHIFIGNGSDEIIDIAFRIFCKSGKDKAICFNPTYGMYEVSAQINDVEMIKIPLNENFQINIESIKSYFEDENVKIIFICSPNNPTGNAMNKKDIEYILSNFKGIIFIDEAYIDFSESESFIENLNEYPNLIISQTLSKAFGLAGLRIGLAFMNQCILTYYNKVKPPYNVSMINQQLALEKLSDYEKIKGEIKTILIQRDWLIEELKKINGIKKIIHSDANFILFEVTNANKTYQDLLSKNIVLRNRTSVLSNCIRLTVGSESENKIVIKTMKELTI